MLYTHKRSIVAPKKMHDYYIATGDPTDTVHSRSQLLWGLSPDDISG